MNPRLFFSRLIDSRRKKYLSIGGLSLFSALTIAFFIWLASRNDSGKRNPLPQRQNTPPDSDHPSQGQPSVEDDLKSSRRPRSESSSSTRTTENSGRKSNKKPPSAAPSGSSDQPAPPFPTDQPGPLKKPKSSSKQTDHVALFKSAKKSLVQLTKKSFYAMPEFPPLQSLFDSMMSAFSCLPEGHVDQEEPEVSASTTLDSFVKACFSHFLDETISLYDARMNATCLSLKDGKSEPLKVLFNTWSSWKKFANVDISGREEPKWIKSTTFKDVHAWCRAMNSGIVSNADLLLEYLQALKSEGKISKVPEKISEITPEVMGDLIEELTKTDEEASKQVTEYFTNIIAGNAKKLEEFSRIKVVQEAKRIVEHFLVESTAELMKIKDWEDDFDHLENFKKEINEAKTIEAILTKIVVFSGKFDKNKTNNLFSNVVIDVLTKCFSSRNETSEVIKAFEELRNITDSKANPYEAAKHWAVILTNAKDVSELRAVVQAQQYRINCLNKFPNESIFDDNYLESIQVRKNMTIQITRSTNSFKDFLEAIASVNFEGNYKDFMTYLTSLEYLYSNDDYLYNNYIDETEPLTSIVICSSTYLEKDFVPAFKDLMKRKINILPKNLFNYVEVEQFSKTIDSIAFILSYEGNEDEAEKWRKFKLPAEVTLSLGIHETPENEKIFNAYKTVRENLNEENLVRFMDEALKNESIRKDKLGGLSRFVVTDSIFLGNYTQRLFGLIPKIPTARIVNSVLKLQILKDEWFYNRSYNLLLFGKVLDFDIIRELYKYEYRDFKLPKNLNVIKSNEAARFKEALDAYYKKTKDYGNDYYWPVTFPCIGFLRAGMKSFVEAEMNAVIDAYEALADVIEPDDPQMATKMREQCANLRRDMTSITIK